MRTKVFFIVVIILYALTTQSQNVSLILYAEANSTIIGISSKKEINNYTLKPWLGYNTGIISRFAIKKNAIVDVNLSFKQKRNIGNPISFNSPSGEEFAILENKTIANYIGIGGSYNYKFPFNLLIGTGLNFNSLLIAKTKLIIPELFGKNVTVFGLPLERRHRNNSFRTFNIAIPIIITYEIKRFLFSFHYEKAILNRVKNASIKERENTFSLGIGYVILKNKKNTDKE